jgi:hypothetical protein
VGYSLENTLTCGDHFAQMREAPQCWRYAKFTRRAP